MKRVKQMLIAITAMLCMISIVLPLGTAAFAASYPQDAVSMDDVNLRRYARDNATIIRKIAFGDKVTLLGKTGKYYKVKFDGVTGYAVAEYIDGTSDDADKPLDQNAAVMPLSGIYDYPYDTTVIERVKLRKTAKATGETIKTLLAGTQIKVLSMTENGFARVKATGSTGYVLASHIVTADIPEPTPKPTATPVPGSERYTELKKGSAGDMVKALQSALCELEYLETKEIDGKFGNVTETAVKTFQKRNGLTQNGIASPALLLTLFEGEPKDYRGYRQKVNTIPSVSGALIRLDGVGEPVKRAAVRLKELGYYTYDILEKCDSNLVAAIKLFEGYNNLMADGELNADDQTLLYSASARSYASAQPTPAPTMPPILSTLRRNSKGDEVKILQQRLTELGYFSGSITGTFGLETEKSVVQFQKKNRLEADGVVGPISRTVLFGSNVIAANSVAVTPTPVYEEITKENVIVIRSGSRGDYVLRLQNRLQELGYYLSRLDGVYLSDDITAVRAFQKANKITVDGTAGYETQRLLYSDSAVASGKTEESSSETLRYGDSNNNVIVLQNRLIELGYLTGVADGKFGKATRDAVKNFQQANQLKNDGVAGADTLAALYANNVVSNKISTYTALKIGSTGEEVRKLQNSLISLGFLRGTADGKFGVKTSTALIAFQKANNLVADGIAGTKTINKLNDNGVKNASGEKTEPKVPDAIPAYGVTASQVRYQNWYEGLRDKCRQYPNATVYDFSTGISWQVNMFSLGKHADSEPLTAADTEKMNRAFGGKTTWTPKAVWVILSDGTVYMASTHNTPHGTSHIKSNNFSGHLCIHFPRTQAQVESIGPYATSHQNAIDLGWQATQTRAR